MIEISLKTDRQIQLVDITDRLQEEISTRDWKNGICHVYCPHTTAGLCINENADPDVRHDLERAYPKTVPDVRFEHDEGNTPAHFLSTLIGPSLSLFVENGELQLGRWQGVFFAELDGPRTRRVWMKWIAG